MNKVFKVGIVLMLFIIATCVLATSYGGMSVPVSRNMIVLLLVLAFGTILALVGALKGDL